MAFLVLTAAAVVAIGFVGWTTNTDRGGRNAGRPARLYQLVDGDASSVARPTPTEGTA